MNAPLSASTPAAAIEVVDLTPARRELWDAVASQRGYDYEMQRMSRQRLGQYDPYPVVIEPDYDLELGRDYELRAQHGK